MIRRLPLLLVLLAAPALAQDQTLPPTGTAESTSNACTTGNAHTTTDEGVSSPGGDWCVSSTCAANPTNDTAWRFTFDTPTSDPDTGTDAQTFRAYIRQCGGSTGITHTCRLDLYCSASLVESGAEQNITSATGQTISETFTYNSGTCGTSGANAELRVYCTASGGTPSSRRVGDIDAAEWQVTWAVAGSAVPKRRAIHYDGGGQ